MTERLKNIWESLVSSLWFVPSILTVLSIGIALGCLSLDEARDGKIAWAYSGGAQGAREVLSVIAASMITIAGVSFSVMIVALTLASQQFGPRLLRNFMRDSGNQVVLGIFIATFSYSLVVLRSIGRGPGEFVPHISVTVAILFALASLGVLIYFIHHAAVTIQAPELIAMVAEDLQKAIDRLFVHNSDQPGDEDDSAALDEIRRNFDERGQVIAAQESGYLQSIDNAGLVRLAKRNELILLVKCTPGDFVLENQELARCRWTDLRNHIEDEIRACFILGTQRTHLQDVQFSLQQLVEVAVRSLSASVNDPFTAISCIDRIITAFSGLTQRSLPTPFHHDDYGKLRMVTPAVSFAALFNTAFDAIRFYGRSHPAVTVRLLEGIEIIAKNARRKADRSALLEQAYMIERASHEFFPEGRERTEIDQHFELAVNGLTQTCSG
jgi:uncharacterized membrane protein